ncbi:hypothetical protein ACQ4LE_005545 [Meloidogyne hapla]
MPKRQQPMTTSYSSLSSSDPMSNFEKRHRLINDIQELSIPAMDPSVPPWAQILIKQMSGSLKLASELLSDNSHKNSDNNDTYDEYKRQCTVVAERLPEAKEGKPTERARADLSTVCDMLDICEVEQLPVAVYRIGPKHSKTSTLPKLLKIEFSNRHAARQFLYNKSKLKSQLLFKNVRLRPSLTPEQLASRKRLQTQCSLAREQAKKEGKDHDYVVYADMVVLRNEIPNVRTKLNQNNH